jgi:hypothetical protein
MATIPRPPGQRKVEYPTSDGKPMAETEVHRDLMVDLIGTLRDAFAADPQVFVSGDLLLFYFYCIRYVRSWFFNGGKRLRMR